MIDENDQDKEIVEIELGDEIDLHMFHPKDTKALVLEFLSHGIEKNISPLRIIHGKGKSQKKLLVYKILEQDSRVVSFHDAGPNWGATIVHLDLNSNSINND